MPGIARSRRQAGSCSRRSARPGGDLARGLGEQDRAPRREPAGLELGRGEPGDHRRGRHVAQAARATRAVARDQAPLDPGGALAVDQLLGDRPGECLERLRPPPRTQPGAATDQRPEQSGRGRRRGGTEPRSWSTPSAKRMRSTRLAGAVAGGRLGADANGSAGGPGADQRRAHRRRGAAARGRRRGGAGRGRARPAASGTGPGGTQSASATAGAASALYRFSMWMSTRNDLLACTSTPRRLARTRARRRERERPASGPAEHLDQHEGCDAEQEAAGCGNSRGGHGGRAAGGQAPYPGCEPDGRHRQVPHLGHDFAVDRLLVGRLSAGSATGRRCYRASLVDAVLLHEPSAHALHAAVHRVVVLENPALLAPVLGALTAAMLKCSM